ncbi:MAG: carboxy terminal-processing peptidase [Verrucomicrobium sp.]|nr:carboxy terminal-processing peptidase [Verrucomicrobium sp.]
MKRLLSFRAFLSLLLLAGAGWALAWAADGSGGLRVPDPEKVPQTPPNAERSHSDVPSRASQRTAAEVEDGKIGEVVAQILERAHYSQRTFDEAMSHLFLKTYLDALDYRHMVFLQGDLDEFNAKYGGRLNRLTLAGDISPAREVYNRFVQRLKERQAQVEELLKAKPDFSVDESFSTDRSKAPWPKDEAEARELWRLQIKYELLQGLLADEKPEETVKTISRRYARLVKSMKEVDHTELLGTYLSALTHAYDPHSDYLTPEDAENFQISSIKMALKGIGAVLKTEDGYPTIVSLVPGGPADLDGRLKANDRIVAVTQEGGKPVDVIDMKLAKVVEMIRGERNTKVTLTILPSDAAEGVRHDVTLVRDEVKLTEQKAKARIYERQGPNGTVQRCGVVILPEFYEGAANDVARLIDRLKEEKIDGLILDLRRDGGGILEEAIQLISIFVPRGPVVQVKNPQGVVKAFPITDQNLTWTGPLIVMAGKSSASASEIVAAALQDYGRALVVGDKTTFGKGTVQTLINLKDINWGFTSDPGELKLTVQKFYRITGDTTQYKGVSSDIVLPSLEDYLPIGEATLPNALPPDQVEPAKFKRLTPPCPFVKTLQDRSVARIGKNPEFDYLKQEIALLRQRMTDKTLSLNLDKRRAERDQSKDLKEKRDKELASLPPSNHKVYVLDLTMLEKGESPKPVTRATPPKDAKDKKEKPKNGHSPAAEGIEDEEDAGGNSPTAIARDVDLDETVNIFGDYNSLSAGEKPKR